MAAVLIPFVSATLLRWRGATALAFLLLVFGCSIDTRPQPPGPDDPHDQVERDASVAVSPPVDLPDQPGAAGSSGEPGADPPNTDDPPNDDPPPGDPIADAGGAGSAGGPPAGSDAGMAGAPGDASAPPQVDGGGMNPTEPDSPGLLDGIRDLLANNPRTREAVALRRIMAAISAGASAANVKEAADALGDVNCFENARTCVAVCSWAVFNCSACAADASCVAEVQENCSSSCL